MNRCVGIPSTIGVGVSGCVGPVVTPSRCPNSLGKPRDPKKPILSKEFPVAVEISRHSVGLRLRLRSKHHCKEISPKWLRALSYSVRQRTVGFFLCPCSHRLLRIYVCFALVWCSWGGQVYPPPRESQVRSGDSHSLWICSFFPLGLQVKIGLSFAVALSLGAPTGAVVRTYHEAKANDDKATLSPSVSGLAVGPGSREALS